MRYPNNSLNRYYKDENSRSNILLFLTFIPLAIVSSILMFYSDNIMGTLLFFCLLALVILCTKDIYSMMFFILFLAINNQLLLIDFKIGSVTISIKILSYICVGLCMCILIYEKRFINNVKKIIVPIKLYILWFIYICMINMIKVGSKSAIIIYILFFFGLSVIFQILVQSKLKYAKALLFVYFISIATLIIGGYIELILGKTLFLSQWAQGERYRYGIMRIGSTVADGNFMCAILLPAFVLFKTKAFSKIINKNILILFQVLLFIEVILTFSRSGLIVLGCIILLMFLYKHKYALIIGIPIIVILIPFIISAVSMLYNVDAGSNYARETINKLAFNLWINNFFSGLGFGVFTSISANYTSSTIVDGLSTMNTYYQILTSSGIIGLIFYISYIIYGIKDSILNLFKDKDEAYIVISVIAWSIIIYTLDCFFIVFLWIIPAVALAIRKINMLDT